MKKIVSLALVATASLCAAPALAAERVAETGREFGDVGVIGIGIETRLDAIHTSTKPPTGDSSSSTQFGLGANIAYFVAQNISIGGIASFDHVSFKSAGASDSDSESVFSIMPMVGYNLWLQPGTLSLWPQHGGAHSCLSVENLANISAIGDEVGHAARHRPGASQASSVGDRSAGLA